MARHRYVTTAIVILLLVSALGLVLRMQAGAPFAIDHWWREFVHVEEGEGAYGLALALHLLGSAVGVGMCIVIAAAAMLLLRRPRDAAGLVLAGVLGVLISELLKALIARPRPEGIMVVEYSYSYPSGHSMGAAALATALALIALESDRLTRAGKSLAIIAAASWTLAMMWSRTAVHAHWLSDTVAGGLLGIAAAMFAREICRRRRATASTPSR